MDAADAAATANEQATGKPGACEKEHHPQGAASGGGHFSSSLSLHDPSFFRTVMEHNLRSNMAIPKAFVQTHGSDLPGSTVDLEGVNGKVWLVTVVTASTGTAVFRYGWHVFAADNNLKAGDSLLFTLVAKNRFTVRVFSKNGTESVPGFVGNPTNPNPSATFSHYSSRSQPPVHHNLDEDGNSGSSEDGRGAAAAAAAAPAARLSAGIHAGRGPTIQEIIRDAHQQQQQTAGEPSRRRSNKPWRRKRVYHKRTLPVFPGWDDVRHNNVVTEDLPTSESPPLPDLNVSLPNNIAGTSTDANPRKRNDLATQFQEMLRSGEFAKRQREGEKFSDKLRLLAEEEMHSEDEKPDLDKISSQFGSQFKRPAPRSPINPSSDSTIKAEPEGDVHSMPASVELRTEPMYVVKTEPMYIVKTEDMSKDMSINPLGSGVSPAAVQNQCHGKENVANSRSSASEKEGDVRRILYPVSRVWDKRKRAETEMLVEIAEAVPEKERSSFKVVEQGGHDELWAWFGRGKMVNAQREDQEAHDGNEEVKSADKNEEVHSARSEG